MSATENVDSSSGFETKGHRLEVDLTDVFGIRVGNKNQLFTFYPGSISDGKLSRDSSDITINSDSTSLDIRNIVDEIKEIKANMVTRSCYCKLKEENECLHRMIHALKDSNEQIFRKIAKELFELKQRGTM
ncbi:Hypothetical predicted protein [Octopus vulgaris]|uniref:Uncharacterized protein n=1 Tax=Octopus vulgaris TaxID=6645 RepID=A0AA36FA25_OCTVU|nr:Hypothetical predicted protein [Octopus vulgaris]